MSPSAAAGALRAISALSFGFALVIASGAFSGFDGASILMHDLIDFPLDGNSGPYSDDARWFSAIGGGLFAALAVMFYLIVAPAVAVGDREVINGSIKALVVWFVIDSAGSVAAGMPFNAVANIFILTLFLWPLLGPVRAASPQEA